MAYKTFSVVSEMPRMPTYSDTPHDAIFIGPRSWQDRLAPPRASRYGRRRHGRWIRWRGLWSRRGFRSRTRRWIETVGGRTGLDLKVAWGLIAVVCLMMKKNISSPEEGMERNANAKNGEYIVT
ncbi:uncharacterized protein BCR38DRAFT_409331 [Pseudomassariella vexata]|uniref:Uncharacterized protein n=1 Tax=Pseudomassariella vexata TaxID=1141098 RepID=A0A1Y2DXI4_9PEZI|nr:uncharacterized protein BCR38DRAFT_409331 [Pseudomassariella vexata]ORY63919.1 hypothetical protein BCR38DRAFT_409331 [Pseudomassariella vexata]